MKFASRRRARTGVCFSSFFLQAGCRGELPIGLDVVLEECGVVRGRAAANLVAGFFDVRANVVVLQRFIGRRVPAIQNRLWCASRRSECAPGQELISRKSGLAKSWHVG